MSKQNAGEQFPREVESRERRKMTARRHGADEVWFGLGMFGIVGWSVAIPTLAGIALGVWIDLRFGGPYSWTLMLMVIGLAGGCANAWYWIQKERSKITKWKDKENEQ